MKRYWHFSLSVVLVTLFFLFSFSVSAADALSDLAVSIECGGTTERILPDGDNFFLPSVVDIKNVRLSWTGDAISYGKTSAMTGTLRPGEAFDLSFAETKDARGARCYAVTFSAGGKSRRITFYHDDSLPTIFVNTSKGLSFIEASKDNRDKKSKLLIVDERGNIEYNDSRDGTTSEIKGRGNATFGYAKKPYQIKLSAKQSLFGFDAAKTWILLANYVDQSQLHNALAFTMGDALNIPYNIQYRHVNLYIDGSYRGLYQLCEKVQIGSGRIDITDLEKANEKANPDIKDFETLPIKTVQSGNLIANSILTSYTYTEGVRSPVDITGGYLVELDNVWGASEPSRFTTENGNTYVVKSPEFASKEEMEYIAALFADMEEAIYSADGYNRKGKHYSEYIDMDSFAGVYVVQELLKNWDGYLSSMFFFKDVDDGAKTAPIYMGPLWDLDNILGNLNFDTYATDTSFLWAQHGKFSNYVRALAAPLMRHKDFAALVSEKYGVLYVKTQEYLVPGGWLERTADMISDSVAMDRTRWTIYDADRWVMNAAGTRKVSTRFVHFTSYGTAADAKPTTALGYLRYFLSARAEALFRTLDAKLPPEPEETTTPPETTTLPTPETTETQPAETPAPETTPLISQETTGTESPAEKSTSAIVWILLAAPIVIAIALVGFLNLRRKKS